MEKMQNATSREDKLAKQKADDMAYIADRYGTQQKVADDQHAAAVKEQEAARKDANRQAYIGQELLQKYLPQYQAAHGTAGMGTSATDAAASYNAYLGRVSGNNANYADNVAGLDAAKAMADTERKQAQAADEKDVLDYYREKEDLAAEQASAGFEGMLAQRAGYLMEQAADGKLSQADYDSLLAYANINRGRLTPAGWQNVQDLLEGYKLNIRTSDEQSSLDKNAYIEKGVTLSRGLSDYSDPGNNFWVKDANGKEYAVELVGETQDSTVIDQANKADSGEVFAYGGKLYLKSGSKVYEIDRRKISKHDEFEALYNLYFGGQTNALQVEPQAAETVTTEKDVSTEEKITELFADVQVGNVGGLGYAPGMEIIGKNGEKRAVGNEMRKPPAIMLYVTPGTVFRYEGKEYIRDDSGTVYEVE